MTSQIFYMFDLTYSTKDSGKKCQKKWRTNILFGSAVIWAEMAADHENGRNSKKFFSLDHGHYVAC